MKEVREMAEKYSHEELEQCITDQLKSGSNSCFTGSNVEETMNVLSKSSYIKQLVEEGKSESIMDAIRKMAASIRSLQQNKK